MYIIIFLHRKFVAIFHVTQIRFTLHAFVDLDQLVANKSLIQDLEIWFILIFMHHFNDIIGDGAIYNSAIVTDTTIQAILCNKYNEECNASKALMIFFKTYELNIVSCRQALYDHFSTKCLFIYCEVFYCMTLVFEYIECRIKDKKSSRANHELAVLTRWLYSGVPLHVFEKQVTKFS